MKVLQINATYGYSSTGLIVKDIGDMLVKKGEEPFFAYQSCCNALKNGYRVGNKLDWKFHALFCRLSGKQAYFSKLATKKLIKYITSIKPDIVHLHNLHSNYIHLNLLLKYLVKENIATVITLHDCWYFTGKCFHYADIGCDRFQTGCGNCPKKGAPPKSFFFDSSRQVLKDKQTLLSKIPRLQIVGCSDWVCGEAKKGILKNCNITRIYNGVDVDIFKPYDNTLLQERYQLKQDIYVVMGMANKWLLSSNKQLLVETVKSLNDKFKLMLVGCKEEQIEYLKGLSENVIPVGFIKDRVELAKHYSLANVFVNATHVDTLPTVNMESICCGTPVITYASCGSPELVLHGCGQVLQEGDVYDVLAHLQQTRAKISESDLKKARKMFDRKGAYQEYYHLYHKLMQN